MEEDMRNISEDDINDDFFEEYGEEMTQAFLSFCAHFREYVLEMDEKLADECMEEANTFAKDYGLIVNKTDDEFYYTTEDETADDSKLTRGVIQLQLQFNDIIKQKNPELWDKALHYAADYGGVGRISFFHAKDKDKRNDKDTGS
jgi:hypothetical protein